MSRTLVSRFAPAVRQYWDNECDRAPVAGTDTMRRSNSEGLMKATRGWILALAMLAACSEQVTGPRGPLPDRALAAIPPTNNTACNKFWASGVSGMWTNPALWNPAGIPTATSSVCINAPGAYTVTVQGPGNATDTTKVEMLALDIGGAGATPVLTTTSTYVAMNIGEGVVVQPNATLRLNNSQAVVINAAQALTNLGTLESVAPCGGGCAKDHVINADIINSGTLFINGGAIRLPKAGGAYENTGTINIANGTMLIPATAGSAVFTQGAGVITGNSNFNTFTIRSGTFSMNGGKVRTRSGASNLKPIVIVDGANLVLDPGATDSITIGVFGSSSTSANIAGDIADLTTIWLAGPTDLNPGATTFLDAAPVNNGKIRIGVIDGGQGALTIGGSGRLTNADSLYDVAISGGFTYHFALEYTNVGTLTVHNTWSLEKAAGTYYNSGLMTGSGTTQVLGNTFVSTATGTVSPTSTSGSPRFRVDGGRLIGVGRSGQITLVNGGTVEPGQSPGILDATSLVMNAGTSLAIELGGTQPGAGYDQVNLSLTQNFSAGGSVDISEINGFDSGLCGQVFEILSWNSTNSGPANFTGLNPSPTRALRVFTHTASLPRKTILYSYDPTVKISIAPNPIAIAEGGSGAQYGVCLDGVPALGAGQTVTVTPTPDAQVTVSPPAVTFTSTNWRAPQFFTVTAVDDVMQEGNHTGTITHAATSNVAAYQGVPIAALTANITDNDVNLPPVAVDDAATTAEDTPVTIDVLTNDDDPESAMLTVTGVTAAGHGTVNILPGATNVRYSPAPDYSGPDQFSYTVSDGQRSSTASVSITVTAVNDIPAATDDQVVTRSARSTLVNVLSNDTDVDGDALTVTQVGSPSHGTVVIDAGAQTVTYQSDAGYVGSDAFTYTISDGAGGADVATVFVDNVAGNTPPVAVTDVVQMTSNSGTERIRVLDNDYDPEGDRITLVSVQGATNGGVSISGRTVLFTIFNSVAGTGGFSYTIRDQFGATATGTVVVNWPPRSVDLSLDSKPKVLGEALEPNGWHATTGVHIQNPDPLNASAIVEIDLPPQVMGIGSWTNIQKFLRDMSVFDFAPQGSCSVTYSGSTPVRYTCTIPVVAKTHWLTEIIGLIAPSGTVLTFTARVTLTSPGAIDPNPANNVHTFTIVVP